MEQQLQLAMVSATYSFGNRGVSSVELESNQRQQCRPSKSSSSSRQAATTNSNTRPLSPFHHLNDMNLKGSKSRLNLVLEITQNLLFCGTPQHPQQEYYDPSGIVMNQSLSRTQPYYHHLQWKQFVDEDSEGEENGEGEDIGIEIDSENSLKPAYELCRV